ncbi:putative zinc- or iron-chelating protein [Nitrospirillum viridazoti]|nr:putative zinc- or iron-chelating protein [Nitrospirillum amazonense]
MVEPIELLPNGLDSILSEAHERLRAIPETLSRYEALAAAARVQQDLSNRLSATVYAHVNSRPGNRLACGPGCSTCCHMPSDIGGGKSFRLSLLDIVMLLEAEEVINRSVADAVGRAVDSVERARAGGTVACPYLDSSGQCGIYEVRPVPCKIWFSRDLAACVRNRDAGYAQGGVNPDTAASNDLLRQFEEPFEAFVRDRAPMYPYRAEFDFLRIFAYAGKISEAGLTEVQKQKVDEGDLVNQHRTLTLYRRRRLTRGFLVSGCPGSA